MRATAETPTPPGLADCVDKQCGTVSRAQLLANGFTDRQIAWAVRSGRWQRIQTGVYALFSAQLPFESQVWGVLLRVGPWAAASHQTAAFLDGLCDDPGPLIHVTVPAWRRVRGRIDGARIHYAHRLPKAFHPSKSLPRPRVEETVLDLVDMSADPRRAESWITAACQRRLTTPERIAGALAQRKRVRWRTMLKSMLADVSSGAHSPLELHHLRRVERAHRLPTGTRQRRVQHGRTFWVDIDYEDYELRVELDGRAAHLGDAQFRDRQRDNLATVAGYATLRYGYADVFGDPCAVAAEQAQVLRARGWSGLPKPCGPNCPLRTGL